MTTKFFAVLTNLGAAKLANATALGTQLQITQMAVGDGGGALPTPNPAQTQLIGEKRRAALNSLSIDAANSSQIIAEQVIPETEGGWWIREIGLLDKDGVLIAIANCPETYKPQLQEGSGRTQTVRMVLIVSSTDAVTLKIDPSVVLATRKYVDDKVIEVKQCADNLLADHVKADNPHTQYLQMAQLTGVVGTSRNAKMSVSGVSATATFTADELIVQTALGGQQYKLSNFSKTINLAKMGLAGMDTGTAPANGYAALYVIYNPTADTSALLAVNATSLAASEVYTGANMPASYTSSALVCVWPTDNNALLITGLLVGRKVFFKRITVLATTTDKTIFTALNIATAVPKNAISCSGMGLASPTNAQGSGGFSVASGDSGVGEQYFGCLGSTLQAAFKDLPIYVSQQIYYMLILNTGSGGFFIVSYEF